MNYFIFYKKTCIAYTDSKKMKKEFIKQFKNKEDFIIDEVAHVDKFYTDSETISNISLYYNNEMDVITNDNIDMEIYHYLEKVNEEFLLNCDRLDKLSQFIRIVDNEKYILSQFFLNYGFMIEDIETMYSDLTDIKHILEFRVFPIINAS